MITGNIILPDIEAHIYLLRILGIPVCNIYSFKNSFLTYHGNLQWSFSTRCEYELDELMAMFMIRGLVL